MSILVKRVNKTTATTIGFVVGVSTVLTLAAWLIWSLIKQRKEIKQLEREYVPAERPHIPGTRALTGRQRSWS